MDVKTKLSKKLSKQRLKSILDIAVFFWRNSFIRVVKNQSQVFCCSLLKLIISSTTQTTILYLFSNSGNICKETNSQYIQRLLQRSGAIKKVLRKLLHKFLSTQKLSYNVGKNTLRKIIILVFKRKWDFIFIFFYFIKCCHKTVKKSISIL